MYSVLFLFHEVYDENNDVKKLNSPEQAWGGKGNIKVVELLRRATIDPNDCGLKLRNCCIKSEHSISATSIVSR